MNETERKNAFKEKLPL